MSDDKKRTKISTHSLPAVQAAPPTTIIDDKMVIDPHKLIKTWVDSAEVLRSVARVAEEGQADNIATRDEMRVHRKALFIAGVVFSILQLASVAGVFIATQEAKEECSEALQACTTNGSEVEPPSR